MARLAHTDADPERGVFLLPNGQPNMGGGHLQPQSPNGSSTSERTNDTGIDVGIDIDETLSTSRETESSAATPTRPLIMSRTPMDHQHYNGGSSGHNGVSNSKPIYKKKSKHKVDKQNNHVLSFWKGREHWCCIFGSLTFLIGAILLTISLLLYMGSRNSLGSTEPCVSAVKDTFSSSSSPNSNRNSQRPVITTQATTNTPTTTFSYDGLVNLAAGLGGQTFQSSTYSEDGASFEAAAAVDGSGNYTLESGSCSLTDSQLQAFWWIDLGRFRLIKRIRIFKPTDCCHNTMMDAEVRIGQSEELSTNALCQHVEGDPESQVVEVVCKRQIYGRFVSIQMLGTDGTYRSLALCEVELYEH